MANGRRAEWRCLKCKPRKASTSNNNSYHVVIKNSSQTMQQQKKQREDDIENNESAKRFKNSLTLIDVNDNVSVLKQTFTSKITDLKGTVQQVATYIKQINDTQYTHKLSCNTHLASQ